VAVIIQTVDGVVANKFVIEKPALYFGRTTDNQVQIEDIAVSNNHAKIVIEENEKGGAFFVIQDMESTNGTFVNEKKIEQQRLRHDDVIRIGLNNFVFIDENERDLERTAEIKKSWIPGIFYTDEKEKK
jgi:pSer/pThr/pTyr-binding forkhead associated (FHA) protein